MISCSWTGAFVGTVVAVAVGSGVFEGVAVEIAVAERVLVGGPGVESSALAGLTLNCRIGQKIKITISSKIDEVVSTTPRENFMRAG